MSDPRSTERIIVTAVVLPPLELSHLQKTLDVVVAKEGGITADEEPPDTNVLVRDMFPGA